MITMRRWKPGDLAPINPRPENSWDSQEGDRTRGEELAKWGVAFTILDEGSARADTLMVLGFNKLWDGCCQCWAVPSEEARQKGRGRTVFLYADLLIDWAAEKYKLHRIHTLIHPGIPENVKWIEMLGFQCESVMERAAPDQHPLFMYVRFYNRGDCYEQAKGTRARLQGDVAKLLNMVR